MHLPEVVAVVGDDGVAQHELYQLAQVVCGQGGLVCALQAQPEIVVQRYVQEQDISGCTLSLQRTPAGNL